MNEWTDWLARNNYGVDIAFEETPPCTLDELADAYVRVHDEETREAWAWCIEQETGAWPKQLSRPGEST